MDWLNSEQLLKVIIESAVDGIVVIDDCGTILMANPATYSTFGYPDGFLIGKSVNVLMPASYASHHDGYLKRYMQTGEKRIIGIGREVLGLRSDGSTFPFDLSISELIIADGKKLFAGTIHDISAQKEAQAEIEKLNKELEVSINERTDELAKVVDQLLQANAALRNEILERKNMEEALLKSREDTQKALESEKTLSELKSRFITTASHEFRTPLSSILSSAKLIGRYTDAEGQENRQKHIKRIETSVYNLNNILNDLLTWSKLEENKITYRPISFSILELTGEVLEEMQTLSKKGQKVVYEHHSERHHVTLDPVFLKNILLNLLSNSIKYSAEHQSVYLSSHIEQDRLHLHVKDEGIGIPLEEQKYLFDRFFRAKNVDSIQGTGLGLNIVKKYVDLMGGEIRFESAENKGCSFIVTIPVNKDIPSNI